MAALFAAPVGDAMAGATKRGPVLKLHDSPLGPVLFSGGNRALYLFTRDSGAAIPSSSRRSSAATGAGK